MEQGCSQTVSTPRRAFKNHMQHIVPCTHWQGSEKPIRRPQVPKWNRGIPNGVNGSPRIQESHATDRTMYTLTRGLHWGTQPLARHSRIQTIIKDSWANWAHTCASSSATPPVLCELCACVAWMLCRLCACKRPVSRPVLRRLLLLFSESSSELM